MFAAAVVLAAHPIHSLLVTVVIRHAAAALLRSWRDEFAVTGHAPIVDVAA